MLELNQIDSVELELLFLKQWLDDSNRLPENAPLRNIPFQTFSWKERWIERLWKSTSFPKMDKYLINSEWMFSPVDTYFPVKSKKTAITIHDIQAFETTLPWSNTKEHKQFRKRWSLWINKAIKSADLVFTVSEFSKKRLIELLDIPESKVKVSGNAVDPVFLENLHQIDAKETNFPYLAVIGGLRNKKGGNEILKLAQKLKITNPDFRLVIWGENDPILQRKSTEIGNIISLEMIPDSEMIAWLKGAYASLFLSWYEGFGIPALEAMACGVPVICSNQASLPEIVGEGALLVHPKEIDKIVDYIHELDQPEFRKKLISKGIAQESIYRWENCAINVYNALSYETEN